MRSHRQILKSSAIIGVSSVINIAVSIIKVKVLAVLLGPAGVGLMGIYQNIMNIVSTIAGCGLGSSGVRQIAASQGEEAVLGLVKRALWLANLILGLAGMSLLWLMRDPVAEYVFGDVTYAKEVGWLGLGVFFSLVAASRTALLRGLRKISDLARVNIIGALIGAGGGILAIHFLSDNGVIWFVIIAPAASALVAGIYAARIPHANMQHDWTALHQQWSAMFKLGIPFMSAGLLTLVTQLVVRSIVLEELGLDATGHFQAAWAISMTYIGFILGAMSADYYPRLTGVIKEHHKAGQLVNEQTEIALLLAGPVLIAMVAFSPIVIQLLFAESFAPASEVLRWQVLGDILKIVSWPMGFILLALGRGGIFLGTEFTWNAVYLASISIGIGQFGLMIVGVSFLVAYTAYWILLSRVSFNKIGLIGTKRNQLYALVLLVSGGCIVFTGYVSDQLTYVLGIGVTILVGAYSWRRLNSLLDVRDWIKQRFQ